MRLFLKLRLQLLLGNLAVSALRLRQPPLSFLLLLQPQLQRLHLFILAGHFVAESAGAGAEWRR